MLIKCKKCQYSWLTRDEKLPKVCPRCKARLDYGKYKIDINEINTLNASLTLMDRLKEMEVKVNQGD